MNTILLQPEKIDLENIDAIESAVDLYVENAQYAELTELRYRLKKYLERNEQIIVQQGSRLLKRYTEVFAKLRWGMLARLNEVEVRELFEQHFDYFFQYSFESVFEAVEQVLRGLILLENRDLLKADIRKFISTSFVQLGKKQILISGRRSLSSVQNWIHDFEMFVGDKDPGDPLLITQYLNTSQNAANLLPEEQKKLEGLIRFYTAMSLSSFTPQGNEDQIMYHDVESGHIIAIDHGKEIDTGVPSDIVAKMTPEEREQARRDVQQRLKEVNQDFEQVEFPLTSILKEQLSRNEELRRAIAQDPQAQKQQEPERVKSLPQSSTPPRVTIAQPPALPVVPKKVEPVQLTAPMPLQPLPVKTQSKPLVPEPQEVIAPTPAPVPTPPPLPPTPKSVTSTPLTPSISPQQPQKPKDGIDYQSLAEMVLAEHALLLASIEAENRFLSLIAAFAKGERTRDEVMTTLTTPIESGGVNLTADIAASCLNTAQRFTEGAQHRLRRRPQLQDTAKKAQPTFKQVTEMMQRHKQFDDRRMAETHTAAPAQKSNFLSNTPASAVPNPPSPATNSVEDIFANLDVAQMQQKSVRPETDSPIRRIDSIRNQSTFTNGNGKHRLEQVMGPIEELKKFSIAELRSFGTNPDAATAFIKEKIDLQTQESISKRAEAIRAWQDSPLHQLYVQIGNASLSQGVPVNQYIDQRQLSGEEVLTVAEFEAIASLNRQLRF